MRPGTLEKRSQEEQKMNTKLGAFSEHKIGCIFRARYLKVNSGRGICAHFLAQKMRQIFCSISGPLGVGFLSPRRAAGPEKGTIFW